MPVYRYIGVDGKGKKVNNIVDAENIRAARVKLRKLGLFPTELNEEGGGNQKITLTGKFELGAFFKRVKLKDVAMLTRQLSTLLNAHIPLVDALSALVDQMENVKLKAIFTNVRERVTEGSKLSDALRAHPAVFNDLFVNMIDAGENSGTLALVCARLAEFLEGQAKLRSKIMSAMIYPIIMSGLGFVMVVVLLTLVVPKLTSLFTEVGASLPLPTRILIGTSSALATYWYIFLVLGILIFIGIKKWVKTPAGKAWCDKKSLKVPIFGNLTRLIILSRFSRTLSTLLNGGVPLLAAMTIVRNMVTNTVLRKVIEQTRDNVREGQSVADPLRRSGEFPALVTHMIAIGEKTGSLETMLERIAEAYDTEVDNTVTALTTLLEPLMILAMAIVVGFIVMAILLPILKLNELAA